MEAAVFLMGLIFGGFAIEDLAGGWGLIAYSVSLAVFAIWAMK